MRASIGDIAREVAITVFSKGGGVKEAAEAAGRVASQAGLDPSEARKATGYAAGYAALEGGSSGGEAGIKAVEALMAAGGGREESLLISSMIYQESERNSGCSHQDQQSYELLEASLLLVATPPNPNTTIP